MTDVDMVLPLRLVDYPRARLLLASLGQHPANGTLFIVVPQTEVTRLGEHLAAESVALPPIVVHSEFDWVPEFQRFPGLKGWYKQQLLKLAAFSWVGTKHYITLDADVICTRPLRGGRLLCEGRTPCHVEAEDLHPDWYRGSRKVLGLSGRRAPETHNVTPAILSVDAVKALTNELAQRAQVGRFSSGLLGVRQRLRLRNLPKKASRWRSLLAVSTPWTEYALYYSFLEHAGLFDRYHYRSDEALYASAEGSIWRENEKRFGDWNPAPLFEGDGPPYFVVVQSNTSLTTEAVRIKMAPYLSCFRELAEPETSER